MSDEATVLDAPEVELDQPFDDGVEQEEQHEEVEQPEPQQATEKVDGRKFNPEWSKALKNLRELHPEHADMLNKLRDETARQLAFREMAPGGLEDFRNLKTTIDALGGAEAAAELMSRAAKFDTIDSKIAAADVSVVDDLPEDLQKGFFGMIPDALSKLSESNPDAFNQAVAPHFQKALAETGLGAVIKSQVDGLSALYQSTDDPGLKAAVKSLYDKIAPADEWYKRQTQGAANMPAKTATPQQSRAEKELAEIRKSQDEGFVKGISDGAMQYQSQAFDKHVATYIKQLNLTDAQKSDLMDSFGAKLTEKMSADQPFQKQLQAYKAMKSRDPKTVSDYVNATIDKYAKPVLDALVTARYGAARRTTAAATTTAATTSNGALRVAVAPSQDKWDIDKMQALGYENTVKKGIYHLQGGKTVQLARPN